MASKKNEAVETVADEPKGVDFAALGQTVVIPDYEQVLEDLNRPAIPEGTFLAVVTKVALHPKRDDPTSLSIKWSLTLNLGSHEDGWDAEGRTADLFPDYYTPYGRMEAGQFSPSKGIGITARMSRALGYDDGSINLSDAVGRQVLVTIKHEQDNRQTAEQAAADGVRWTARVVAVARYTDKASVVAPRLDGIETQSEADSFAAGVEF